MEVNSVFNFLLEVNVCRIPVNNLNKNLLCLKIQNEKQNSVFREGQKLMIEGELYTRYVKVW